MSKCANCGNDYSRNFAVTMAGHEYHFDSFECAIHLLAPQCSHCSTRIIGHGLESNGRIFCCGHCARGEGAEDLRDSA